MIVKQEDWEALAKRIERLSTDVLTLQHELSALKAAVVGTRLLHRPPGVYDARYLSPHIDVESLQVRLDALVEHLGLEWHEEPAHAGFRPKQEKGP